MSTLQFKEEFEGDAEPERVWAYLINPDEIAVCLPGATLDEIQDERTFHGHMTVKVGPVTVAYKGTLELQELDHAGPRLLPMRDHGLPDEPEGVALAHHLGELDRLRPDVDPDVAFHSTSLRYAAIPRDGRLRAQVLC